MCACGKRAGQLQTDIGFLSSDDFCKALCIIGFLTGRQCDYLDGFMTFIKQSICFSAVNF